MNEEENHLEVNDYLDLYLLSGTLGDNTWQEEILEKLKSVHNEITHHDSTLIFNLYSIN